MLLSSCSTAYSEEKLRQLLPLFFADLSVYMTASASSQRTLVQKNEETAYDAREALDITIQVVQVAMEAVPLELAKGILLTFHAVLILIQERFQNLEDFRDFVNRCQGVEEVLSTIFARGDDLDERTLSLLTRLQTFINAVYSNIERKANRNPVRALFSGKLDAGDIVRWKDELAHHLLLLTLHHNYNVAATGSSTAASNAPQAISTPESRHSLPPMPSIFYGRDKHVQSTVAFLIAGEHVALVGPGGVGKSSIAKAVLHNAEIADTFGPERYFIEFDIPSEVTHATFMERVAHALGLPSKRQRVLAHLETIKVILAFDNAETFLEILDADSATRIAETMNKMGALPSVRMLVTSRSRKLPSNFRHKSVTVGDLGLLAAREAFSAVYTLEPLTGDVDSLLKDVHYHPLATNLLAHAGRTNGWSIKMLLQRWSTRKTEILKNGDSRSQDFAAAMELSLSSPVFRGVADMVYTVMRAISFLPNGIRVIDIPSLFPKLSLADAEDIADALVRCSLASWSTVDYRLSVCTPIIRTYINETYNKDLPHKDLLMTSIRDYQWKGLLNDPGTWVQYEAGNIEQLLSFDLTSQHVRDDYAARLKTLLITQKYLDALYSHNPLATNILSLLKPSHELCPVIKARTFTAGTRRSNSLASVKAKCLAELCWLEYRRNSHDEAFEALRVSIPFCRSVMPLCNEQLASCLRLEGILYQSRGDLIRADQSLREGSVIARLMKDPSSLAKLDDSLSRVALSRGNLADASALAISAQGYFQTSGQALNHLSVLLHRVDISIYEGHLGIARNLLEEATRLDEEHDGGHRRLQIVMLKVDIEGWGNSIENSIKLLDQVLATETQTGSPLSSEYLPLLRAKAVYEARMGYINEAQNSLQRMNQLASEVGVVHSTNIFASAYVNVFAGHHEKAEAQLQALVDADDEHPTKWRATLHRALGEIALLRGVAEDAKAQFNLTARLCDEMGVRRDCLCVGYSHWRTLPEQYAGWTRFLSRY